MQFSSTQRPAIPEFLAIKFKALINGTLNGLDLNA